MRPWLNVTAEHLMQSEQRVLKTINTALASLSKPPLDRLYEIFEGSRHFLTTFPELDPYPTRDPDQYCGPILTSTGGAVPEWPNGRGPKVFAYLKPQYRQIEEVLGALNALQCRTAAFIGGLSTQPPAKMQSNTISISHMPYDMRRAATECDFGVCHAGHGTTCELLLHGKPLLMLPIQLEQYLTAKRVSDSGAGVFVDQENPDRDFKSAVHQLINDPNLARGAEGFARRYTGTSQSTVSRIVDACEAIADQARPFRAI